MTTTRSTALAAITIALCILATACTTATDPGPVADRGYERITEAAIGPGEAIPAPTGDVVLTITGAITTTNVDGALAFDMDTLESLGLVSYEVDDDQAEGRRVAFTGVLLSDLLAAAGIAEDAEVLEMTALNDYVVDVPVADAEASPVMVATMSDEDRMPVSNYGPTRLVYPYDSHDLSPTIHDPRWIWQLASIDVR